MAETAELKPVTAEPGRPLFHLVKETVRAAIDAGRFAPGERLPSTKALSTQLDVSLVTVHRALQELVVTGVLRRGQGRGTFVHESYAARSQVSRGLRFGLVFHDEASLADNYHGHVLEGVRRGAEALGADLVLLHFGEDWRKECSGFVYVNPMQEQLDRSPWFGSRSNGATGGRLKTPPVVVLGASFRRDGVPSIDTDNADMAAQAVKHLAELGHQRIAYVGGGGDLSNNIDRYQGFVSACVRTGLRPDQRLVVREPGWRLDDSGNGRAALHAMLRSSERPTAVFAAGYYYALDVYAAAAHVGLSIPGNLSVVGVDDPPSSAHLSPPLTTLRQPLEQLGRLAARRLHDAVCGGEDDGVATLLPAQMVVRGSTGTAETPGENR